MPYRSTKTVNIVFPHITTCKLCMRSFRCWRHFLKHNYLQNVCIQHRYLILTATKAEDHSSNSVGAHLLPLAKSPPYVAWFRPRKHNKINKKNISWGYTHWIWSCKYYLEYDLASIGNRWTNITWTNTNEICIIFVENMKYYCLY